MGIVYRNQDRFDEALEKYNEALVYYKQMESRREMSQVYQNIGNIYSDLEESDNAIENYRHSLSIAIDISDSVNIAMTSQSLGLEFLFLEALDSAEYYATKALGVASVIGLDLTAMDSYKNLADTYQSMGDYENAYSNLSGYVVMRDSLYNIEKRDLAEEIEAKYQNEQKTREIALLDSERKLQELQLTKRRNERNAFVILSLFVLLMAGLLYRQYRIKQKANAKLQELDQLKSNFFANISHEFRTPLTLIKGPITRLEQDADQNLSEDEVRMIRRNTNKVLGLVTQLLDLSRIDQGQLKLNPTEGDVFKCFRAAAVSFNSHAAQRDMDYHVNIPEGTLWASFDRDKLDQIVYNLLSNAFKFSDDGERVVFESLFDAGRLVIKVSDTGRGIAEDKLDFVFDRFYQVDATSTKDHEGSGIGLALSKDMTELMDGTITVASEEGKGTEFEVHLPIERIQTPPTVSTPEPNVASLSVAASKAHDLAVADHRKVPEILLVEDNEDMRHFIKNVLLDSYKIVEAHNGEEGLKKATALTPDLIITDLMMPKMDGITMCDQLKKTAGDQPYTRCHVNSSRGA